MTALEILARAEPPTPVSPLESLDEYVPRGLVKGRTRFRKRRLLAKKVVL
jgi:hypothetical protein